MPEEGVHDEAIGQSSDNINVVYVDGLGVKEDIILTQTPTDSTVEDFWHLIFEEWVRS